MKLADTTKVAVLLLVAGALPSCSGVSAFVADTLPGWAGGLPKDTPPRPGTHAYDEYIKNRPSVGSPGVKKPAENPEPNDPSVLDGRGIH